jgi:hypothetical protein
VVRVHKTSKVSGPVRVKTSDCRHFSQPKNKSCLRKRVQRRINVFSELILSSAEIPRQPADGDGTVSHPAVNETAGQARHSLRHRRRPKRRCLHPPRQPGIHQSATPRMVSPDGFSGRHRHDPPKICVSSPQCGRAEGRHILIRPSSGVLSVLNVDGFAAHPAGRRLAVLTMTAPVTLVLDTGSAAQPSPVPRRQVGGREFVHWPGAGSSASVPST